MRSFKYFLFDTLQEDGWCRFRISFIAHRHLFFAACIFTVFFIHAAILDIKLVMVSVSLYTVVTQPSSERP